jgi:ElaB/YqjD/DUF883 family membrane-anchored ribosome-binding protein
MKVNRLERYWSQPEGSQPKVLARPQSFDEPRADGGSWLDKAGDMLGDYPQATIIVALSVGVLLGWLIKRR